MIRLPGERGKDLCDNHLGMTRRDILRVGGSGMLGLSLGGMLEWPRKPRKPKWAAPRLGKAKSVIYSTCRAAQATRPLGPQARRADQRPFHL